MQEPQAKHLARITFIRVESNSLFRRGGWIRGPLNVAIFADGADGLENFNPAVDGTRRKEPATIARFGLLRARTKLRSAWNQTMCVPGFVNSSAAGEVMAPERSKHEAVSMSVLDREMTL